jgi:hypothetical protein
MDPARWRVCRRRKTVLGRSRAQVCEPDFRPVLRRARDGAVLDFISTSSAAAVAQWTDEREIAPPPCTAVQWSIAV